MKWRNRFLDTFLKIMRSWREGGLFATASRTPLNCSSFLCDLQVTGACKICGGGGEYSRRAISNVGELVTVSYRPTNGSIYCEVPDVDPLAGQASLTQAQLDSALAYHIDGTGLRGNLVFDTLNYGGVNQDGVASGSTASFRLRDLYDTSSSTNFPPTSYPINPSGSVTAGQFPPSRTGATNIGALCTDQGWVTFSNFAGFTAQAQTEFMFQVGVAPSCSS
jgi:hypothetical protein